MVESDSTLRGRWAPHRRPRLAVAGLLAATLAGSSLVGAHAAAAAVPTFPDNLLVFPNRDFITVEGYAEHKGETGTITVRRPSLGGQVVGSAQGVVSGGDVAFEVNHPGGVCWGNGTGLKVTPDILPGRRRQHQLRRQRGGRHPGAGRPRHRRHDPERQHRHDQGPHRRRT